MFWLILTLRFVAKTNGNKLLKTKTFEDNHAVITVQVSFGIPACGTVTSLYVWF